MKARSLIRINVLACSALAASSGSGRADQDLVRLGELIGHSQSIVMGRVVLVEQERSPGPMRATIEVDQSLLGEAPGRILLRGDTSDPDAPAFGAGVRVLAFLRRNGSRRPDPVGFEPVQGRAGIIEVVSEGARRATLAIMGRVLERPEDPRLEWFRDDLRQTHEPPPRPLVAFLLEELSAHLEATDEPLLMQIACDETSSFLPAVQLWATSAAGARKLGAARPCLEGIVSSGQDAGRALTAIEALGDLGDPGSLPVLLPLLEVAAANAGSRGTGGDLTSAAVLALGKISDPAAVPALLDLARQGSHLALHSTVVHALGLIGGSEAGRALTAIGRTHPSELVRAQARQTRQRLAEKGRLQ